MNKEIKKILMGLTASMLRSKKSKCLFYHDIHSKKKYTIMSTSLSMFENHIHLIRDLGFEIVQNIHDKHNQIEITFDDGFQGIYQNIDLINRLQVPITLFVSTSFIDKDNFLSKSQIKELHQNPFINIASHTHTHSNLTMLSDVEIRDECVTSKNILEDICSDHVYSFCYPKGYFNKKVTKIVSLFYEKQYSSIPGNFHREIYNSVKHRSLSQFLTLSELKTVLYGGDNIFNFWYRLKHVRT